MATCLVSGIAGFIGSHVADELISLGHRVIGIDDLSGGCLENVPERCEFWRGSVCDRAFVDELFNTIKIDYVYHLAAYAAEGLSHFIRCFNYENNLLGSMTLINNAIRHECKCFVFTSSIAVYGEGPFGEGDTPCPEDPYGIAKLAVENDLRVARKMFGLPYIVLRPHNVYGERQNIADPYRNVVGIFMRQILDGEPCTIFGDGEQRRGFTYIGDVAPIIARAPLYSQAMGLSINLGTSESYSVCYLAKVVQNAMESDTGIKHLPAREEVKIALSNHDLAVEIFGTQKETQLDVGLKRMADWVKRITPRKRQKFDEIEIERGLPPSWREI